MEYTDFVADFATRTLRNLDQIQDAAGRGEEAFPVTQLWNSLLGLVVLPRERDLARIPDTGMAELWATGWPRFTAQGREQTRLRTLVRDLRNAVSHFNVEFVADERHEIATVVMWTQQVQEGRPVPGSRDWVGRLPVSDLERLARGVAELYLKQFSRAA